MRPSFPNLYIHRLTSLRCPADHRVQVYESLLFGVLAVFALNYRFLLNPPGERGDDYCLNDSVSRGSQSELKDKRAVSD